MPWRIVGQFFHDERLSESTPVRAVAKLIVRGAAKTEEKIADMQLGEKAEKYTKMFKEEYKKALEAGEKK